MRLRGQQVQVEEITGFYAVAARAHSGTGAAQDTGPDPLSSGGLQALDVRSVVSSMPGMQSASIEAFQDAGWTFVRSARPPQVEGPVAKVFVRTGGRPVLGTNRLSVGFRATVGEAEAIEVLARHGAHIVAPLTFAQGLYQVEIDPSAGADVLDAAAALDAEEAVEFAEPEFLEVIGGR